MTPLQFHDILELYERKFGGPTRIVDSVEVISVESAVQHLNRIYLFRKSFPFLTLDGTNFANINKLSAYQPFHWEADATFQRSFLHVLLAHYQNGFTLLRSGLDLVLEGAVLQCLSQGSLLAKHLDARLGGDLATLQQFLLKLASEDKTFASEMDMTSIRILDVVGRTMDYPKASTMEKLVALQGWGILSSAGDILDAQKIHNNLSKSAHGEFSFTDIGRTNVENPNRVFDDPPPILPESAEEYMAVSTETISLAIIVTINLARQCLPPEWVDERLSLLKESELLQVANLEQVDRLLKKYVG